jgi:hypothetical protein
MGIVSHVMGKLCVTRGGDTIIVSDVSCTRLRAYIHRHEMYEETTGWTKQAPLEVHHIFEQLVQMVVKLGNKSDSEEESNSSKNKIFREPPHFRCDNYFVDDKILNPLGDHGFGATITNRCDRLPGGVPDMHMCK